MNKKKAAFLGSTLVLGALMVLAGGGEALAAFKGGLGQDTGNEFFIQSAKLMDKTLGNTQTITYGVAGLGAIGLGMMAFFGKFQWTWFFGLIGGLVLIAGALYGIKYVTGVDIGQIEQSVGQ